jgi:3',5'-cyclic AMP phosphodiesterase CpdA
MPDSGVTQKTVRLLHLSDIHFGAADQEALDAVKQFTAHVKPDGIIIAGDITQTGKRSEFEAARAWFDDLGFPVITAPGNHDTPVYHLPARVVAPFDRYERYMENRRGRQIGNLAMAGESIRHQSARSFQGR